MTIYDNLDWHLDAAIQAGQPEENAFAHIGIYLAWLVRHDLHNRELIRDDWVEAIRAGEMAGSDLQDAIDGKLVADVMTEEGAAFTGAHYQDYLKDYEREFAGEADYSVPDDAASYARMQPRLDRRYREWVERGRPSAQPEDGPLAAFGDMSPEQQAALRAQIEEQFGEPDAFVLVQPTPEEMPHAAPELEALIPTDLTDPPMSTSSVTASMWGDQLLKRALKRLGVESRRCHVANGIGGEGQGVMTVSIYSVPGGSAADLERELATVIHLPSRSSWQQRTVGQKSVHWAEGAEFTVAYWADDGRLFHASADADGGRRLEDLINRVVNRAP